MILSVGKGDWSITSIFSTTKNTILATQKHTKCLNGTEFAKNYILKISKSRITLGLKAIFIKKDSRNAGGIE